MAGQYVDKNIMDSKAAQALLELRGAFMKVEAIASYLAHRPRLEGEADPLDIHFGYTPAESYNLRVVFETLDTARVSLDTTLNVAGRQLTGLE